VTSLPCPLWFGQLLPQRPHALGDRRLDGACTLLVQRPLHTDGAVCVSVDEQLDGIDAVARVMVGEGAAAVGANCEQEPARMFHILRAMALGADATNCARAMMMALGCIQALECNKNTCPTGVATQDPYFMKGLVVEDKKIRVANYHKNTVESFVELMGAAGIGHPDQINRTHVYRRVFMNLVKTYEEIYPTVPEGCLLDGGDVPFEYEGYLQRSSANAFEVSA